MIGEKSPFHSLNRVGPFSVSGNGGSEAHCFRSAGQLVIRVSGSVKDCGILRGRRFPQRLKPELFGSAFRHGWKPCPSRSKSKPKSKASGQECPLHTIKGKVKGVGQGCPPYTAVALIHINMKYLHIGDYTCGRILTLTTA